MSTDSQHQEIFDPELILDILVSEFETDILLSQISFDEVGSNCRSDEPY
jgi:hypothetical protein